MINKRLFKLLSHAKKYVAFQVLWQWLSLLAQVKIVFSITSLIYSAFYRNLTYEFIVRSIIEIVVCVGLLFILDRLYSSSSFHASSDVKQILRAQIYEKTLRLGSSYKDSISTSYVVQLASEGVEQLEIYFGKFLSQFFYSILAPFTLFAILSFKSLRTSLVLLIFIPFIFLSILAVMKISKKHLATYWESYAELGSSFFKNLHKLITLKNDENCEFKEKEFEKENGNFTSVKMNVLKMQLISTSLINIMACGGAAAGTIVSIIEFVHGTLNLGEVLSIILLSVEFFIPLKTLESYFPIAMKGMVASDNIFAFLDIEEPQEKTLELSGHKIDVEIDELNFSYSPEKQIIKNVNMVIPSSNITAFVGLPGCGKSTVAKILSGRNKNYEGSIKINGLELKEIKEFSLMKNITMVAGNSHLFKGTVRENLLVGNETASEMEMVNALREVNLWSLLEQQQGLETEVFENASNFSGGQSKKLAIARALLHDSPMYIFDEVTSNIDSESEGQIMNVINNLSATRTVVLISHHLANVIDSSNIFVIEDGRIIESGSHRELMELHGNYYKLFESQKSLENYSSSSALSQLSF